MGAGLQCVFPSLKLKNSDDTRVSITLPLLVLGTAASISRTDLSEIPRGWGSGRSCCAQGFQVPILAVFLCAPWEGTVTSPAGASKSSWDASHQGLALQPLRARTWVFMKLCSGLTLFRLGGKPRDPRRRHDSSLFPFASLHLPL